MRPNWPPLGFRVCAGCGCYLPREDVHSDTGLCAVCEPRTDDEHEYRLYVLEIERHKPAELQTAPQPQWWRDTIAAVESAGKQP